MEILAIVSLIILLAVIGVAIWVAVDYFKFKQDTVDVQDTTTTKLGKETVDRTSNVKYVVDQVNTVNSSMATSFGSNIATVNSNIALDRGRLDKAELWERNTLSGLNAAINFTSNIGSSNVMDLWSMPGAVAPDMQLLKHVTAISGMTAANLASGANGSSVQFCSAADKTKCVSFPDASGNTSLTAFTSDKSIIMNSPTLFTSNLTFSPMSPSYASPALSAYGVTTATTNAIVFNTPSMGISTNQPKAVLHVGRGGGVVPNSVQIGDDSAPQLIVNSDGLTTFAYSVNGAKKKNVTDAATFFTDANGNLVISASNIIIQGTLNGKTV